MIKKIVFISSILFLFSINAFSQKDTTDCITEATITGYDSSRCICCTGWIIFIDNQRYLSRTDIPGWEKPKDFTLTIVINNKVEEFPIKVCINYSQIIKHCRNQIIINWLDRID